MQDYLELGHMSQVKPDHSGYFVPHHSVINEASTTTKLRVVFNGSHKRNNNQSINDNLLVGPKLQQDLFCILIRFRIHKIIITADIKKMYRQIQLHSDHRKYQQIFWRNTPDEPVKTYQLHTVTYGFASSSFLAARCLQELASAEEKSHPKAAEVILRDFYVDDLITGADTVDNANAIFKEINTVLNKGGFELHKIHSNQLSISDRAMEDKQPTIKTLGVIWDCDSDTIKYSIHLKPNQSKTITKREILSVIARIFDPLGLVGPATISGKIIMQKLWATKLNWDESLPIELHTTWNHFLQNFHALGDIRIPRLVISHQNHVHGFCDVSQRVLGDRMLNFEEMYTLLAMIEACLNSRPITPLSNDPHDLTSLTPGHFLIGTPLTAPAQDNIIEVPTNRLTRYQLITQMRQHFWRRWSQDYLHTLQQRKNGDQPPMTDQQLEHWSSSRKTTLFRFIGPLVESRNYIQDKMASAV
jgi:hypothetical protein